MLLDAIGKPMSGVLVRLDEHNREKEKPFIKRRAEGRLSIGIELRYVVKMEDVVHTGIPEEMYQLKLLAAIGLSKTKSEELKKGIRQLRYGRTTKITKVRELLDNALKQDELSALVRLLREEEMH